MRNAGQPKGGDSIRFKAMLLTMLGLVFLALGFVGLFVPVLPTTPFLLAAASCLASSPRIHAHMMRIPFVHEYLSRYREGAGLSRRTVCVSLCFLWSTLFASILLLPKGWLTWLLPCIGVAVTAHILWIAKPRR